MVLGNTKAGKSTFLNNLICMRNFLVTGASKATSFFWKISFSTDYPGF
jgi:GTPase Era involved in 16S rRNA processing